MRIINLNTKAGRVYLALKVQYTCLLDHQRRREDINNYSDRKQNAIQATIAARDLNLKNGDLAKDQKEDFKITLEQMFKAFPDLKPKKLVRL